MKFESIGSINPIGTQRGISQSYSIYTEDVMQINQSFPESSCRKICIRGFELKYRRHHGYFIYLTTIIFSARNWTKEHEKKNFFCGTKDVFYVEVDESRQICITTLTLDNAGVKS